MKEEKKCALPPLVLTSTLKSDAHSRRSRVIAPTGAVVRSLDPTATVLRRYDPKKFKPHPTSLARSARQPARPHTLPSLRQRVATGQAGQPQRQEGLNPHRCVPGIAGKVQASVQSTRGKIVVSRLTYDEQIGHGTFGAVYKGTYEEFPVAVKVAKDKGNAELQREARCLRWLKHPNIVTFLGALQSAEGRLLIVLTLLDGGTLQQYISKKQQLPNDLFAFLYDISSALEYVHRHGIVHGDVKGNNVLLDTRRQRAVLADFGTAREDGEQQRCLQGLTHRCLNPDDTAGMADGGRFTYHYGQDVYAFAILALACFNKGNAYAGLFGLLNLTDPSLNRHLKPADSLPPPIRPLIKSGYAVLSQCTESARRPTMREMSATFKTLVCH